MVLLLCTGASSEVEISWGSVCSIDDVISDCSGRCCFFLRGQRVSRIFTIRSVWVEIAQGLGNVKGFLQCDGCGDWYLREGKRRAKAGQRNYCLKCQKGDLGAKKVVARRRQALKRQARQLYAEGVSIEGISQQLTPGAGRITVDPETVRKWVSPEGSR